MAAVLIYFVSLSINIQEEIKIWVTWPGFQRVANGEKKK